MKIFSKIKEKINNKIKLVQSKIRGKKYVHLQKPIQDMSYGEVEKEFLRKENIIFTQENSFVGRNFDLTQRFVFDKKDNNFAIDYFIKLINNDNISKSIKLNFIHCFCRFFDDNEVCAILNMEKEKVDEQYKIRLVKEVPEKIPEELILEYFDYTDINLDYVKKTINELTVDGKITLLNTINDDEIKEKVIGEEVKKLEFEEAKKIYEQVIFFEYNKIEEFYIKEIKNMQPEEASSLLNEMSYISPNLSKAFDKVIKPKNVQEVIDYIDNNDVKKGGIIYLNRKFSLDDKKNVFYNLKNEEKRKNALVIFTSEMGKKDFTNMVKNEVSEIVKQEMIDNANMFLKTRQFSDNEIEKMKETKSI